MIPINIQQNSYCNKKVSIKTIEISSSGCMRITLAESGLLITFKTFGGAKAPAIPVGPIRKRYALYLMICILLMIYCILGVLIRITSYSICNR